MWEVLNEESSLQLLELIHHNWSVVLNRDKGTIALDDVCKNINLWTNFYLSHLSWSDWSRKLSICPWLEGA
jgi:hypothetical protein